MDGTNGSSDARVSAPIGLSRRLPFCLSLPCTTKYASLRPPDALLVADCVVPVLDPYGETIILEAGLPKTSVTELDSDELVPEVPVAQLDCRGGLLPRTPCDDNDRFLRDLRHAALASASE
mmetsp:Transcript_36168/g.94811  ORF Transcript_36168/g.94811 Transcript_36168/m.94811 type:complete len:121 (-) Transcript_36168:3971-4333(-)